ncbi:hypothetical protein B0H14DRAFT_3482790 [Mycena olivaceomarginata]|nr:hypothetical protein B0H14DRAFT_3482790 [Mycena olivaceomarginata]
MPAGPSTMGQYLNERTTMRWHFASRPAVSGRYPFSPAVGRKQMYRPAEIDALLKKEGLAKKDEDTEMKAV